MRPRVRMPSRWVAIFIILASLFVILTSLAGYAVSHHHILTWDEWDLYTKRLSTFAETPFSDLPFWLRIWGSRFGHRLFFPGLIQKANWLWFHAGLGNLILVSVSAQIVAGIIMCRSAVSALA